ncbi:MAG TPA: riboflavin kinase, partial [Hanamia sp.]|nr:riboflavin kinase [Hanamia sp.]
TANEYLGYEYFFEGKIVEGNKLGKTLGYPTANILVNDAFKLIPAYGVYAVTVSMGIESQKPDDIFIAEADYKGMMNIGIRPTIGDNKIMIEVNIFNFDKDIYGRVMRVYVKKYMRPEIKFNNLEELKVQLAMDEIDVKKVLSGD